MPNRGDEREAIEALRAQLAEIRARIAELEQAAKPRRASKKADG